MALGQTLKSAREAKGLTASQLAAQTRLLVQVVNGLETEDFRMIPAPIYGRGFIKLYCEAVGLEPKPLQDEFTRIYSSGKAIPSSAPQTISAPPPKKEIVAATKPMEEPTPMPEPKPEANPAQAPSMHEEAPTMPPKRVVPDLKLEAEVIHAPKKSYGDIFGDTYPDEPKPESTSAADRFRDTMSNVSHGVFSNVKRLPSNVWRIALLVMLAVAIIAGMAWGISILYRVTANPTEKTAETPVVAPAPKPVEKTNAKPQAKPKSDQKASPKPTGKLKSTGQHVKPLYID